MSTKPRLVRPGFTYLITRRCAHRQFLLQPSEPVLEIVSYALALIADRYGIQLHAWCFLTNHYHLVASDPRGRIPDFMRDFHSLVARALNAEFGRWENFWSSGEPSLVHLIEEADVLDKVLYTVCNPVSSGLVPESRLWPGLLSHPESLTQPLEVSPPDAFFRASASARDGKPLMLAVTPPSGWTLTAYQDYLKEAVIEREADLRGARKRSGQGFLGLAAIRKQGPEDRPSPGSRAPRRKLSPRIACKDAVKRDEALARLEVFVEEYRLALRDFNEGAREVLFPFGTFLMRVRHSVRTADGP